MTAATRRDHHHGWCSCSGENTHTPERSRVWWRRHFQRLCSETSAMVRHENHTVSTGFSRADAGAPDTAHTVRQASRAWLGYREATMTMTVSLAVSTEHQNVTDRRTDKIAKSISRISVVTRDKHENENYDHTFYANENRNFWLLRH